MKQLYTTAIVPEDFKELFQYIKIMICFEFSKALHPIENLATGNDLFQYHIQGVLW